MHIFNLAFWKRHGIVHPQKGMTEKYQPQFSFCLTTSARKTSGFTLIEVIVAAGLIVLGFTAVYVTSSRAMQLVKTSSNSYLANQMIQERVERIRATLYTTPYNSTVTITSGSLQNWLGTPTVSGSYMTGVNNLIETVTLADMSPVPTPTPIQAKRQNGSATVITTGTCNSANFLLQVTVGWTERSGSFARSASTVIKNPPADN